MDNLPLGAENNPNAPFNEPLNTEHKRFVSVTISYYDTVEAPVNSSDDFIEKSFYKRYLTEIFLRNLILMKL